ncbi:MAG: sugar transferase [Lachnospiraceae bacterium]|jgi:exopolysaccharide biosynthesis polyprenyl glycosylphosphotransferase|nr:sugar transferase [Lachnospiraceae bacterium]
MGRNYHENSWVNYLEFVLVDSLCVQIALALAHFLRNGSFRQIVSSDNYAALVWTSCFALVAVLFFSRPYDGIFRRGYIKELKQVMIADIGIWGIVIISLFVMKLSSQYSRIMLVLFLPINLVLMYAGRILCKSWMRHYFKTVDHTTNLFLITEKDRLQECLQHFGDEEDAYFHIVGIALLDDDPSPNLTRMDGIPIMYTKDSVIEFCRRRVVDEVFIYISTDSDRELAEEIAEMGIKVHIGIADFTHNTLKCGVGNLNGMMTLTVSLNQISRSQYIIKRAVDICGGLVGCILTGVIFVFVAPIIKWQSPGPIFFSQTRIGRGGRPFKIYKFRSMYVDAEERKKELMARNKMSGFMFKVDHDPRIYPFGHFLRQSSLDEFPQFWNVLSGSMTLCGTRPPTLDEYVMYEPRHKSRLAMKPGLTGLWQVSGRSDITDFEEVVKLDNEYIRNWNLRLDMKIILRTVAIVVMRAGAR